MNIKDFTKKVFKYAKEQGLEEYEVYYKNSESIAVGVFNEEIDKYNVNTSYGVSFRGKYNDKMGYSYTEVLDEDSVKMLVDKVIDNASTIENEDIQFIYGEKVKYTKVNSYYKDLEKITPNRMIDIALDMEKQAKNMCDKVVNIAGSSVSYTNMEYGLINSKGIDLNQKSNLLMAYISPVVEDNNKRYDGTGYKIALKLDDIDSKKIAEQGVNEALERIGGESIDSGDYKVVISNECMAAFLETFSSPFCADIAQKGMSLLKDKEGEIIASDKVTIIDNPLMKDGLSSVGFDDEGVATFKKEVVKNGKLITLLHNLKTAYKQGVKTTGNGFKASYSSPVSISPTNFYIEPGKKSLDEIFNDVKEGLYLTEVAGLHSGANTISGDFSLAAKGFLISNGKKGRAVEEITVAGNFFNLLKDIEEVGSDLKFPMSSIGSPSVVINKLSVAGK